MTTRCGREEVRPYDVVGRRFDYTMWSEGGSTGRKVSITWSKEVRLHDVVGRFRLLGQKEVEREQGTGSSPRPRERPKEVGGW